MDPAAMTPSDRLEARQNAWEGRTSIMDILAQLWPVTPEPPPGASWWPTGTDEPFDDFELRIQPAWSLAPGVIESIPPQE